MVMSDYSANDGQSAVQSRKDDSIGSKLDHLIKSDKSLKRKMEEFDKKFLHNGVQAHISRIEKARSSIPNTEEDNTLIKIPSFRQQRGNSRPSTLGDEKPQPRVSKYPDYLAPAITSSSFLKRSTPSVEKYRRDSSSSKKQPFKAMRMSKTQQEENKLSEPKKNQALEAKVAKASPHFFSNFNHANCEKFLPKVLNMRINTETKTLEFMDEETLAKYLDKEPKSRPMSATKTASFKKSSQISNSDVIRKSFRTPKANPVMAPVDSPKLCHIIKSIANSQDFKSTCFEEAQSFQDFSVVTRTDLWLKALEAKLDQMRKMRVKHEMEACKDKSFYDHQSLSLLNANKFSNVDSKIPHVARASSRSSVKSRENSRSASRSSICKAKKATQGYSQIFELRNDFNKGYYMS
jgi:hypothetical protein